MTITQEWLDEFEFQLTHKCRLDNETIRFNRVEGCAPPKDPCVYLWVGQPNSTRTQQSEFEVLYVGKAISGPDVRMRQHEGGFRHSSTGAKNLHLLKEYIQAGNSVFVYSRVSSSLSHLGHTVNGYSFEEEIIYEKLRPIWNRAKLASKRSANIGNSSDQQETLTSLPSLVSLDTLDPSGQLKSFFLDLNEKDKKRLSQLIEWAVKKADLLGLDAKLIGGYKNQPDGYNGIPQLIFAQFHETGRAKNNTRKFSIPLRSDEKHPLTLILSDKSKAKTLSDDYIESAENSFCPKSLEDFLENPSNYFLG